MPGKPICGGRRTRPTGDNDLPLAQGIQLWLIVLPCLSNKERGPWNQASS